MPMAVALGRPLATKTEPATQDEVGRDGLGGRRRGGRHEKSREHQLRHACPSISLTIARAAAAGSLASVMGRPTTR